MSNPFVAEIRIFTGNFAPVGWALCDGQLLPISQNTALFSLLGTTYGGNGTSNFALPNLQGCAPMHPGQGPGLTLRDLGETGGEQTLTLLQTEMPQHSHFMQVTNATATTASSGGNQLALAQATSTSGKQSKSSFINMYSTTTSGNTLVQMNPFSTSTSGGNLPHNNLQPFLGLNFIIALQGVYPARS
jgi:microcystin-dependent protein